MFTNCGIAIKTEYGYETIYVHNDGYPEYMWPMLATNYNSEELAAKLVNLGDASYVDKRLDPTPGVPHTFDYPEKDVSVFYHRDRGESWNDVAPGCFTKKDVFDRFYYSYIWEDGCWNFYKGGKKVY